MNTQGSNTTDNHAVIKKWVEIRYGTPALLEGIVDKSKAARMLRINFPSEAKEGLKDISWELFFEIFDKNNLSFLYQEGNDVKGELSKFYKIIVKEINN